MVFAAACIICAIIFAGCPGTAGALSADEIFQEIAGLIYAIAFCPVADIEQSLSAVTA